MTFRVGQKVVRVGGVANRTDVPTPALNEVCTVSGKFTDGKGRACIELLEYPMTETTEFWPGFLAKFFRPVTDISVFKEILDRVNGEKELTRV